MGTWSTEILGNDESMDLYSIFERMYFKKTALEQIKKEIREKFLLFDENGIPILIDNSNNWLAYTQICWECSCLDEINFITAEQIVNEQIDLNDFEDEGRTKRMQVLQSFLKQIKKKAKKKTIPKRFELIPNIKQGDCIAFKYENDLYGGAICLDIRYGREDYPINSYLLAITRIQQKTKPTIQDFLDSHLLIYNFDVTIIGEKTAWKKNKIPNMTYCYTGVIRSLNELEKYEHELSTLESIGNLKVKKFKIKNESFSLTFNLEKHHINQFEWEKIHPNAIDLSEPLKKYLL